MEAKLQARKQGFLSPWTRWGWSWLTAVELLLQYTWRVTLPLWFGQVVVCDRYIYDALADWAAHFDEAAVEERLAARTLCLLTRRPRMAYWLDVPAEVAESRSVDGIPSHFLAAQSAAYGHLAVLYGLRRLDGRRSWEEISDEVVCEVLSTHFAGYRTWMDGLFWKNPGQWK
jgi:thymidylate kinase